MKHTPGPWRISRESGGYAYISSPPDIGRDVWWEFARVVIKVERRVDKIGSANAHLIAAAPDMLRKLKAYRGVCKDDNELETIIAKAEGML